MSKNRPEVDAEGVRALKEYLSDPTNSFVFELFFRTETLLTDNSLSKSTIALEMLQSVFSAYENDVSHEELKDAYPVQAWREDTVQVPRAWLRVLVESWAKYKESPDGSSLGEAFHIEGGGQGQLPVRATLRNLKQETRLSKLAAVAYLMPDEHGSPKSWETALHEVAMDQGVSPSTVKRASEPRRKALFEKLRDIGALKS